MHYFCWSKKPSAGLIQKGSMGMFCHSVLQAQISSVCNRLFPLSPWNKASNLAREVMSLILVSFYVNMVHS